MGRLRTTACIAALSLIGTTTAAQVQRPAAAPADTATTTRVDSRSPRAAIADFLQLARRGQFEAAARFMGGGLFPDRGAELARRLKAVFDQRLWIEIDDVSAVATGDLDDGLPDDREQIGMIPNDIGVRQPVQLQRNKSGEPPWVFAQGTIGRIDQWYESLPDRWLRDHMPAVLQHPGPFGIDLWQWTTLVLLLPFALLIGWLLGRTTISLGRRVARRTETHIDDRLLEGTAVPIVAIWTVISYRALANFIGLSIGTENLVGLGARAFSVVFVTWLVVRTTHVLEEELPVSPWAGGRPELRSVLPLLGRVLRFFLIAVGAIAFVAQFGYSVTTLLAGLGIGGIAVALAMQKTLEHTFGSVAIGLDQPIRVGDWVKIGETEGEVEAIGLRSTRLRTLERSLVVLPNGRLADMQMENFGVRDRILLRTKILLTYETRSDQVRRIRDDIERLLTEHPLVWPGRIIVRLRGFSPSSLDVDVIAWLATTDYNVFRAAREEIYLQFMQIVERAGSSFAYPTQTIHLRELGHDREPNGATRARMSATRDGDARLDSVEVTNDGAQVVGSTSGEGPGSAGGATDGGGSHGAGGDGTP